MLGAVLAAEVAYASQNDRPVAVARADRAPGAVGDEDTNRPVAKSSPKVGWLMRQSGSDSNKAAALYWRDRNHRWHRYDPVGPSARIDVLLEQLDSDPTAIFWG